MLSFRRRALSLIVLVYASDSVSSFSVPAPPPAATSARSTEDQAARVWRKVASALPSERHNETLSATAPPGLRGTYYVNGLASCTFENGRLVHPFEAHGFLKAVTFAADGSVALTARYVDTPVRKLERRFGRPLFRGAMSNVADMRDGTPLDRLSNALSPTARDTANLAVRRWGDVLLATADNCAFYGMCADTLDTLGTERFDGALGGYKMLAHTRVDAKRNRLVACALAYQPWDQSTVLTFFEFDEEGKVLSKITHRLPAFVTHDWTITENYYVVPAATAVFDLTKLPALLSGGVTATDIFEIDATSPGTVLLIPRDGGDPVRAERRDGRHSTIFHLGPAHEDEDGNVVAHPFCFDRYQFGGEMGFDIHRQAFDPTPWSRGNGGPRLERWKIDMTERASGRAEVEAERLSEVVSDMPTFHPDRDGLPCSKVYTVCGIRGEKEGWFPFNSIAKHCLDTGKCEIWPPEAAALSGDSACSWDGGTCVRAEPLFVPRAGALEEDDGYVLSTVHCSESMRTTLEVLDAKNFGAGPIQKIDLGELMGWNVHSSFEPSGAPI